MSFPKLVVTGADRKHIKPILICSVCGVKSDSLVQNLHAHDTWNIAPQTVCPDCNGYNAQKFYEVPATEKGMVQMVAERRTEDRRSHDG